MKKFLGLIKDKIKVVNFIFTWIITLMSFVISIVSIKNSEKIDNLIIILIVIIINCIYVIVTTIFETLLYKKSNDIEKRILIESSEKIKKLDEKNFISLETTKKMVYLNKYCLGTLNKYIAKLYLLENSYYDKINKYKLLDKSSNDINEKILQVSNELTKELENEFKKDLKQDFDQFLSNIIKELKGFIDQQIKYKNKELISSISIKLSEKTVATNDDRKNAKVITIFRDYEAYSRGKREIRKHVYRVQNNTGFQVCFQKPYFLKNNIKKGDSDYTNENKAFLDYYNSTIVVPIYVNKPENEFYGFLTTDTLNGNKDIIVFDETIADVMIIISNILGVYFYNVDCLLTKMFQITLFDFNNKKNN